MEQHNSLNDKELVFFFTTGISLTEWARVGNLNRELELYNYLATVFKKIYFVIYGSKEEELKYSELLRPNIEILPKKIHFLPSKLYLFLIPFLYRKILRKVYFLKTNQMPGSLAAVITKIFYKKKLIVRCGYELLRSKQLKRRPWLELRVTRFLEKISYTLADKIIITSLENKKFIENEFGIFSDKIELIPNYIDTELFRPLDNIQRIKNRICYVGRLEEIKNLSNLILAVRDLPIRLVFIGAGPLREKLNRLAIENYVKVDFMGRIDNDKLPQELNKSEIFILPSLFEGNPKVLLEAMSCGLPCIGTDVEGINNIVKHKENGYLCGTDANSIRDAIVELLNDRDLKIKLGEKARQTILENYSFEKISLRELGIYNNL